MRLSEIAKYVVYRTPILRALMAPSYDYKVSPGQLAAIIDLIDDTREVGGVVVEIGVAKGQTSTFILEHMRTTGDDRKVVFVDTFNGFTEDSVRYETERRGKTITLYDSFRYGHDELFRRNLAAQGYVDFEIVKGDASLVDWSVFGGIGAVLLDIDLYKPTIEVLKNLWAYIVPGGGIVVDDCLADTQWDGSLQAYEEFIKLHDFPFRRVGNKGGLIVKPSRQGQSAFQCEGPGFNSSA